MAQIARLRKQEIQNKVAFPRFQLGAMIQKFLQAYEGMADTLTDEQIALQHTTVLKEVLKVHAAKGNQAKRAAKGLPPLVKNVICRHCPAGFFTARTRRRHEILEHSGAEYICEQCLRIFEDGQELIEHLLTHKPPDFKAKRLRASGRVPIDSPTTSKTQKDDPTLTTLNTPKTNSTQENKTYTYPTTPMIPWKTCECKICQIDLVGFDAWHTHIEQAHRSNGKSKLDTQNLLGEMKQRFDAIEAAIEEEEEKKNEEEEQEQEHVDVKISYSSDEEGLKGSESSEDIEGSWDDHDLVYSDYSDGYSESNSGAEEDIWWYVSGT